VRSLFVREKSYLLVRSLFVSEKSICSAIYIQHTFSHVYYTSVLTTLMLTCFYIHTFIHLDTVLLKDLRKTQTYAHI